MTTSIPHLRIARPVSDLARARAMYCAGLGLRLVGSFEDHGGFDGVMLGSTGAAWHLELTVCRTHPVSPSPTCEDLLVLYLPDRRLWQEACDRMLAAGFQKVAALNPYWEARGATFADPDGYRTVLQNAAWSNVEPIGS
jgi:catechol 2,3-dioxygenase-like lactoylglutathione lyase family enzyme